MDCLVVIVLALVCRPNNSHFGLGRLSGLPYTDYYNKHKSLFGAVIARLFDDVSQLLRVRFPMVTFYFI
jgi:hypothetical protein